jgi:hypothetical protein
MINKEASIAALAGMTTAELINIIDEDYYRSMIGCTEDNADSVIDSLVTELVSIQEGCALAERYDLAIACRGRLTALAMQINVRELF